MTEPQWIVNDIGELGVLVDGRAFFLYKGESLEYRDGPHDDDSPRLYRPVEKREFGEVCRPEAYWGLYDYPVEPDGRYRRGDGWVSLPVAPAEPGLVAPEQSGDNIEP